MQQPLRSMNSDGSPHFLPGGRPGGIEDFVGSPGTLGRKALNFNDGFLGGFDSGIEPGIYPPVHVIQRGFESGRFLQAAADMFALAVDRQRPTHAAPFWLVLPLQEVRQQDRHPMSQFALFATAHVFDLFS